MRLKRFALLALVSVFGCARFTPSENVVYKSDAVGASASLMIGHASRADVLAALGQPGYRSDSDRTFGYLFAPIIGTQKGLLVGPCSQLRWGEREVSGMDDLWLAFDANGTLQRYDKGLVKKHGGNDYEAWQAFQKAS